MTKHTPDKITELLNNQIFVYGANKSGRHGAGAAKLAFQKFGAKYGKVGLVGQSYGLCTKDENIKTLPLNEIKKEVEKYISVAMENPQLEFLTTEVACGLAGYKVKDIAPLFYGLVIPSNVLFPKSFHDYWNLT